MPSVLFHESSEMLQFPEWTYRWVLGWGEGGGETETRLCRCCLREPFATVRNAGGATQLRPQLALIAVPRTHARSPLPLLQRVQQKFPAIAKCRWSDQNKVIEMGARFPKRS